MKKLMIAVLLSPLSAFAYTVNCPPTLSCTHSSGTGPSTCAFPYNYPNIDKFNLRVVNNKANVNQINLVSINVVTNGETTCHYNGGFSETYRFGLQPKLDTESRWRKTPDGWYCDGPYGSCPLWEEPPRLK